MEIDFFFLLVADEVGSPQIAVFQPREPLTFEHSISSLGYLAHLDQHRFIQGSTYEHDFDSIEPDSYGETYLRKRLKRTLPALEKTATLTGQWAGVRLSTPNRKPILGRHKELPNTGVFTGLGSKGLMFGRYLADHFARHLTEGDPLMKEVDIKRFYHS
ncbi:MAG: FAD-dependent oxidoreductase [Saprospiraceae bacterium]|nr:FAD-dependent oxidoreductase [Saprospiraceae bacterium]